MQSYYIKPKAFYDSFGDVQPSQPYNYSYGDRPVFEFSFLPNEIAEGDTLVFAIDNDMVFYDSTPENLFHSASCMVVCKHDVTAEEATAGKVQMRIETRTVKFRDVTNGKVRPVEVVSGLYRKRGSDDDINYVLLAKGRAMANGIIADYDSLPEPITTDEYYTKDELDGLLAEKADEDYLTAHTSDTDIHVTLQDKSTWDSKADLNDIGSATITITQGGTSKGAFSVNASENVTIEVNDGAQADWAETDPTAASYVQHKPTTISGYGITDAYTKTEVDNKLSTVYKYCGTVSAYSALPSEGQSIGDVYNVEQADSSHGIKAGDNVAWTSNGSIGAWDVLAGYVDLTNYMEKPSLSGSLGQVLTITAGGSAWQNVPTEIPAGGSEGQVLTMTSSGMDWEVARQADGVPYTSNNAFYYVLSSHCSCATEYNQQSNVEYEFKLYGSQSGSALVSAGSWFSFPDTTIEFSSPQAFTLSDADTVSLMLYAGTAPDEIIAELYKGNEKIRESVFTAFDINSLENRNNILLNFENIIKHGTYSFSSGETIKIKVRMSVCPRHNTTYYYSNVRFYFNNNGFYSPCFYINNKLVFAPNVNALGTLIDSHIPLDIYHFSWQETSYGGDHQSIYPSTNYFYNNLPTVYFLGEGTELYFNQNNDNYAFLFSTDSNFTYTAYMGDATYINKPLDLQPSKTYLISVYAGVMLWTEVEVIS